jgi:hypothetical protein
VCRPAVTRPQVWRRERGAQLNLAQPVQEEDSRKETAGLQPTARVPGACTGGPTNFLIDEILAAVIILPLAAGATLLAVMIFGSTESGDRALRVLRWIRDREEPSAQFLITHRILAHPRPTPAIPGRQDHSRRDTRSGLPYKGAGPVPD